MVIFVPEDHTNPLMSEHPENPKYSWYSSGMSTCTLHEPLVRDTMTIPGQYQDDHMHSSPPCQNPEILFHPAAEIVPGVSTCTLHSLVMQCILRSQDYHGIVPGLVHVPPLPSSFFLFVRVFCMWSLFTVTILDQYWNEHMHTAPPLPFLAEYPRILKDSDYSTRINIMHTPP